MVLPNAVFLRGKLHVIAVFYTQGSVCICNTHILLSIKLDRFHVLEQVCGIILAAAPDGAWKHILQGFIPVPAADFLLCTLTPHGIFLFWRFKQGPLDLADRSARAAGMSAAVEQVHGAGNVLDLPPYLAGRNPITGKNINEYGMMLLID